MLQSFFEHPLEDRITWHSNDGVTKRVLDYILSENYIVQYVTDCKVENQYKFDSDHRLLSTFLHTLKSILIGWVVLNGGGGLTKRENFWAKFLYDDRGYLIGVKMDTTSL